MRVFCNWFTEQKIKITNYLLKHKLHILFFFFLVTGVCFSQSEAQLISLNTDLNNLIDGYYIKYPNNRLHSSIKPYLNYSIKEADDSTFHLYNYKIKNLFLFNDVSSGPQLRNRFAA